MYQYNYLRINTIKYYVVSHLLERPWSNVMCACTRRWDIMVMSVVLYNAWSVPMEVSFGLPADPAIEAVSVAVDVIFGADILVSFRTA